MREQHQQLKQAKDKARLANAREDEIHNLHRTLSDIQVTGDLDFGRYTGKLGTWTLVADIQVNWGLGPWQIYR